MKSWDVIVVGAGIIGLSLAIELRKRGASVLIVERGEPGHEASRAAGGMLVDSPLETPPVLQSLATASARMYPEFAHELELESEMKVDLRDQGAILFPDEKHFGHPAIHGQMKAHAISLLDIQQLEPELRKDESDRVELELARQESFPDNSVEEIEILFKSVRGRALYLKERSVDPRALTTAAWKTAKNRGVDFSSGDPVTAINISDDQVSGVTTIKTTFLAEKVVNCAGAWSSQLGPHPIPTHPVKGQMLCLAMHPRDLIKHVIRTPDVYLIPRSDGRLLVGATVEEAGFDKRTDPDTMKRFHQAAIELVPKLAEARILEDWAGLRPGTPDNLPILGSTSTPGYYVATGHFRDGILLAPITARLMAQVIHHEKPDYDLTPFSLSRFSPMSS